MSKIKFDTETEQFLYEERKQMMIERDEARKELQDLKQKSSDTFDVRMFNLLDSNQMYMHPTDGATMIIKKDGHTISLGQNEIKQVVKCAGGNFRR
jgi:hypothetical protein